jgi:hypothetical protein
MRFLFDFQLVYIEMDKQTLKMSVLHIKGGGRQEVFNEPYSDVIPVRIRSEKNKKLIAYKSAHIDRYRIRVTIILIV